MGKISPYYVNILQHFFISIIYSELEEAGPEDGRIIFKKRVKRKSDLDKSENAPEDKVKTKKKKEKHTNHSLLSFNDEDEDI